MKVRLEPIPKLHDLDWESIEEYLHEKNYRYLLDCAKHYASLMNKTITEPEGTLPEKVLSLYYRFLSILPRKYDLNFECNTGKIMWVIYFTHHWKDHTFFFMPVKFITTLKGRMKEIAMSFMNLFIRKNGLIKFDESYELEYLFESLFEKTDSKYYSKKESDDIDKLLNSYYRGSICKFLKRVYDHQPIDVIKAINEYDPVNSREKEILDCFRSGIRFISGESNIMNYDYDPYIDDNLEYIEEYPPLSLSRLIRYVYDTNDNMSNEIVDYLNSEMQESYSLQPISSLILTPKSKLFVTDDYPDQFCEWFIQAVEIFEQ